MGMDIRSKINGKNYSKQKAKTSTLTRSKHEPLISRARGKEFGVEVTTKNKVVRRETPPEIPNLFEELIVVIEPETS
jgi:hypothetical protein